MDKFDKLTITFDEPHDDDICVATVCHVTPQCIRVLKQFYGKDAEELYQKLTEDQRDDTRNI